MVTGITKATRVAKTFCKVFRTGKSQQSDEVLISAFNLTKKERMTAESINRVLLGQLRVIPHHMQGIGEVAFGGTKFATKKAKLLEYAEKIGDKKLYKQIQKADNPETLYNVCSDFSMGLADKFQNTAKGLLKQTKGKTTLEVEQIAYGLRNERADKMLGMYEAIASKSTNPEVLKIEQELREVYGMKNVNLQDDLPRGEEILRVVQGLKSKGFPIPENVIVSDLHMAQGELLRANDTSTMILQSTKAFESAKQATTANAGEVISELQQQLSFSDLSRFQEEMQRVVGNGCKGQFSTFHPDHLVSHECLHGNQPNLLAVHLRKIPKQFKPTAENISLYVNQNNNFAEIITELETKLFLNGSLPENEMKLYKYLKA